MMKIVAPRHTVIMIRESGDLETHTVRAKTKGGVKLAARSLAMRLSAEKPHDKIKRIIL